MRSILTFIFLTLSVASFGQATMDSASYWVNPKYLACLDSGKSVCHCEEQNNFLMLDIDAAKNSLTIQPSIYFSWEMLECSIQHGLTENSFSVITPGLDLDSGTTLTLDDKQLTLTNSKQTIVFIKIKVKKLDETTGFDLGEQIGVLNCKPLLMYSIKPCKGNKLLLSHDELLNYISKGQISICCSDDYHYNEMSIENSNTEYLVTYNSGKIEIKEYPKRDRGNSFDPALVKGCQLFYRVKR